MERTLIILKPDAVDRRLAGEILGRFERKGLRIAAMKLSRITSELAARHYEAHVSKPFYPSLERFITGGPVVLLVLEGEHAISVARKLMGKTAAYDAEPGTIRGEFGLSGQFNLVHGSDSPESATREIGLFFSAEEIHSYETSDAAWCTTPSD